MIGEDSVEGAGLGLVRMVKVGGEVEGMSRRREGAGEEGGERGLRTGDATSEDGSEHPGERVVDVVFVDRGGWMWIDRVEARLGCRGARWVLLLDAGCDDTRRDVDI